MSAPAARFIYGQLQKRGDIASELIDIASLNLPVDDAGEAIKDARFSASMEHSDAIVVVTPEYNHSFPGLLKHVLDSCLKEYVHKAVGIVGVSAGSYGGTRVIENLLPVLRELGLVCIFWDVNFGPAQKAFDASGQMVDPSYIRRTGQFLDELAWMAKVLRYGRETIPVK
jgi:NAD(P)H-dependent FMN reductase